MQICLLLRKSTKIALTKFVAVAVFKCSRLIPVNLADFGAIWVSGIPVTSGYFASSHFIRISWIPVTSGHFEAVQKKAVKFFDNNWMTRAIVIRGCCKWYLIKQQGGGYLQSSRIDAIDLLLISLSSSERVEWNMEKKSNYLSVQSRFLLCGRIIVLYPWLSLSEPSQNCRILLFSHFFYTNNKNVLNFVAYGSTSYSLQTKKKCLR